jgi:hypothetical protein
MERNAQIVKGLDSNLNGNAKVVEIVDTLEKLYNKLFQSHLV